MGIGYHDMGIEFFICMAKALGIAAMFISVIFGIALIRD